MGPQKSRYKHRAYSMHLDVGAVCTKNEIITVILDGTFDFKISIFNHTLLIKKGKKWRGV